MSRERMIAPPLRQDGPVIGLRGRWREAEAMYSSEEFATVVDRYTYASPEVHDTLDRMEYVPNDAYLDACDAKVVAVNTIAPAQERNYIDATLATYASLDPTAIDSRTLLYCNWLPKQADDVDYTLDRIKDFQRNNPHFPLAYAANEVEDTTTIAFERKKANAIALQSCTDITQHDLLILHHDGDMVSMNSTHFLDLYTAFKGSGEVVVAVNPSVTHELTGQFPNIDTVIAWGDYTTMVYGSYYSLGTGLSARAYMASKGFNVSRHLDEMTNLIASMCERQGIRHPGRQNVGQAELVTASRRLYDQIRGETLPTECWPDFALEEVYRTRDTSQGDDITLEVRDRMLRQQVALRDPENLIRNLACIQRLQVSPEGAIGRALYMAEMGRLMLGGPDNLLDDHFVFPKRMGGPYS